VELNPDVRQGGDRGLPVALGGEDSPLGKQFFEIAKLLVEGAEKQKAQETDVFEIS
jgi:ATP-binding protein involved in chromosome partitioning